MKAGLQQKWINDDGIVIKDYRSIIFDDNINPSRVLDNYLFCIIAKVNSIGHYQYNKEKKYFIYREASSIHELKKIELGRFISLLEKEILIKKSINEINIEAREGKYHLSYLKHSKRQYFQKYNPDIFNLLVEFYKEESVNMNSLRRASWEP